MEKRHLDLLGDVGTQDGDSHFNAVVGLELRFQGVEKCGERKWWQLRVDILQDGMAGGS